MLSDLFEVQQWIFLPSHDRGHSTESGFLQLLASVEGVTKLEQSTVIFRDLVDQMSRSVQLSQSELVMVLVVQDVQQRTQEWVQVVQDRELGQNSTEFLVKRILRELDFTHVKSSNSGNLEVLVDNSRGLSLRLGKNNVQEVAGGRDRRDGLEATGRGAGRCHY